MKLTTREREAVSKGLTTGLVLVILVVAAVAGIAYYSSKTSNPNGGSGTGVGSSVRTSSSIGTSSSMGESSSGTSSGVPNTITYETAETPYVLDPATVYDDFDESVMQNVYEPLLWYNSTCSTCVIPWLAQSYTSNAAGTEYNFTLRSGIRFADGEPLNSSAVWFSINRAMINDGSLTVTHGTEGAWILQQLSNQSLSSFLTGTAQPYGNEYVQDWLDANFIQVTGPLTFTINVMHPNAAFPYLFANPIADIISPGYVEGHDLAVWTATNAGYALPNPTLSGNFTQKAIEYFDDLMATCNGGSTPSGCGNLYLNNSAQGSQAGTGPYTITSDDLSTNVITLQANPNYWGGPYQFSGGEKIEAQIKTVIFKFVADQTTREIDIQDAAKSGQAMAIDVEGTNLYDVANKSDWLGNGQLVSTLPGVSVYGAYPAIGVNYEAFATNVTNAFTGAYFSFQPFADIRFRTAFADAVNMTQEWIANADKLGQISPNGVSPNLLPSGVFNSSIKPTYSYDPDESAKLLLQAMQSPVTTFHFVNGAASPPGLFNNTFGCGTLTNGICKNPVAQTLPLIYNTGDTIDEAILNDIAGTINNISSTYNMGLTVSVQPVPNAIDEVFHMYMYPSYYTDDYPWITDFTGIIFSYTGVLPTIDNMNYPVLSNLENEAANATATDNLQALVSDTAQMDEFANQQVMYIWTFNDANFVTMTSNIHGLFWNSALFPASSFGGVGTEYFATLY
jgi:ABC-type transport system substrate-binding protein